EDLPRSCASWRRASFSTSGERPERSSRWGTARWRGSRYASTRWSPTPTRACRSPAASRSPSSPAPRVRSRRAGEPRSKPFGPRTPGTGAAGPTSGGVTAGAATRKQTRPVPVSARRLREDALPLLLVVRADEAPRVPEGADRHVRLERAELVQHGRTLTTSMTEEPEPEPGPETLPARDLRTRPRRRPLHGRGAASPSYSAPGPPLSTRGDQRTVRRSPHRRTSACSTPTWSSIRPTVWSTRSSIVRGLA